MVAKHLDCMSFFLLLQIAIKDAWATGQEQRSYGTMQCPASLCMSPASCVGDVTIMTD